MKIPVPALLAVTLLISVSASTAEQPEPGPENSGLRLRLVVTPDAKSGKEGYDVRLDLLNSSKQDITLRANWWYEADKGDVKDYLEGSVGIDAFPPCAIPGAQVPIGNRTSPQPRLVLKAGKVLPMSWHADGRRLKSREYAPSFAHNPELPFPGLYSVVATLKINRGDHDILLRSNEQLVPVGGSRAAPKFTRGPLWETSPTNQTARLGLGSLQQVEVDDEFRIEIGRMQVWKLTITNVAPESSYGRLVLMERVREDPAAYALPRFPEPNMDATLILKIPTELLEPPPPAQPRPGGNSSR
jgi:hypothetical protein